MSTSCMQAIKQQLEAMPLEEFEDLLKGVAVTKGHEARTQHGELISQLKHHVKVQPDEPIQTKPTDKECKTIWKSFSQKEKNHGGGGGNIVPTFNGTPSPHLNYPKEPAHMGAGAKSASRPFSISGDQNANPIASSSSCSNATDSTSTAYPHSTVHNSVQGKFHNYNNHHHLHHQSTLSYNNSLDGDPGGYSSSRRSHERDSGNTSSDSKLNASGPSNKNSLNANENVKSKDDDDDDTQETYLDPEEFTGSLPSQYVLPNVSKFNATSKDLPLQMFSKSPANIVSTLDGTSLSQQATSSSQIHNTLNSSGSVGDDLEDQPGTSLGRVSWDAKNNNTNNTISSTNNISSKRVDVQLKDAYKAVASVTSGVATAPAYMGRAAPSSNEETYGTIRAVSPTLPSSSIASKSPTSEGSQLDKPTGRRGPDRKKKASRNVLRETVINPQDMPGYKGEMDIDKLCEFVEGNQTKPKKTPKDKKQKDGKPNKGTEKQILSKAASLDENSLGYGSKKSGEETTSSSSKNRNSKDVEKKNTANITKSANAICGEARPSIIKTTDIEVTTKSPIPPSQQEIKSVANTISSPTSGNNSLSKITSPSQPLVNGGIPSQGPKLSVGKTAGGIYNKDNKDTSGGNKTPSTVTPPKGHVTTKDIETKPSQQSRASPVAVVSPSSDTPSISTTVSNVVLSESKQGKHLPNEKHKSEEEKATRPDEAEGPYVLVQSKKKREKKKQQRESENFARSHQEQSRREGVRQRRSNAERRKSVGSVPGSENSECSDDDDSVRSLPAGECTPRERIPKPCSSSGGTPQTSYADIARMSKDETGRAAAPVTPPTVSVTPVAVTPVVAKTPVSTTKPTAPSSVVPVVTSPEDMNFPALSPSSSSEKTGLTPVNAAVWPCRPRIADTENQGNKEKSASVNNNNNSNSAKPEDVTSVISTTVNNINIKDASFPPVSTISTSVPVSVNSTESLKCSLESTTNNNNNNIKSVPNTDAIVKVNNNNNINKEVVKIAGKQIFDAATATKIDGVSQNGVLPRTSVIVEIASKAVQPAKIRADEKRTKEKLVKSIQEDCHSKIQFSSKPASENGDLYTSEPVVFCGGKFDSTQLPVGQKIGFEFGFGVIEALNDNTGASEPAINGPKSAPSNVANFGDVAPAPSTIVPPNNVAIRSQVNVSDVSQIENCSEKAPLKQELPAKPTEIITSNSLKGNGKNKGQTLAAATTTSAEPANVSRAVSSSSVPPVSSPSQQSQTQKSTSGLLVTTAVPSVPLLTTPTTSSVPAGQLSANPASVPTPTTSVSSQSTVHPAKSTSINSSCLDFAQIFTPSKASVIPESVRQAPAFHENYASRIVMRALSKEGQWSYHRV